MRERASCQNHDYHNKRQFMVVLRPIRPLYSAKIKCIKCTSGRHKLKIKNFQNKKDLWDSSVLHVGSDATTLLG